MSKRIVYCADGTWDSANQRTNVYRLFKALPMSSEQASFYDDGVGADCGLISHLLGGAFGLGLWQKIKHGYTTISHVYEEGDELFLFGFSRGAYTARSLAGMISACGLPTKNFSDALVDTAFEAYRDRQNRARILEQLADCDLYPARIKMVGVWDTVGALGIPSMFGGVDPLLYGFLDTELSPKIENAYHALAIDEMRCEFPPTLWTSPPTPGQTVEQVWFCGVHSDVGGGEPASDDGRALSDVTLTWMMDHAQALGLQFDGAVAQQYAVPLDSSFAFCPLHTSWTPICGLPRRRTIPKDAVLANSVRLRLLQDRSWRPENLAFENGALANGYRFVDVVGSAAVAVSG